MLKSAGRHSDQTDAFSQIPQYYQMLNAIVDSTS